MFYEFVLLNFVLSTVHTYVTLDFQPEILRINENINITCTVKGIDKINSKLTRQWSKGPDLICYNGHPIDPSKYTEILTHGNQFKLQIKNVSELDFNCKYQCRYGFEARAKSIQSSKNNFEYPPANEVRAIVHSNESDPLLTIYLHFKKIFPMPRCTVLIEGSSRSFNATSSKTFGHYYEVVLRHQSIDKLPCNEEVVVTCKLIKEYIIPTEDRRTCLLKGNPSKERKVKILSTCIPVLLLIILITVLIIYFRKKIKKDTEKDSYKNKRYNETQKKNLQYKEESANMKAYDTMYVSCSLEEMT
ncbi:uncharacterized protein [Mytilus edulis]|uniref:uncharacterized protein n=1 Tax=Mytilus edulis TaxID=6550 RepID=UPI0039EF3929